MNNGQALLDAITVLQTTAQALVAEKNALQVERDALQAKLTQVETLVQQLAALFT